MSDIVEGKISGHHYDNGREYLEVRTYEPNVPKLSIPIDLESDAAVAVVEYNDYTDESDILDAADRGEVLLKKRHGGYTLATEEMNARSSE